MHVSSKGRDEGEWGCLHLTDNRGDKCSIHISQMNRNWKHWSQPSSLKELQFLLKEEKIDKGMKKCEQRSE